MAAHHGKIKRGMGGSRNGRSRWEHTEVLKDDSKKARRAMGRAEVEAGLAEADETGERCIPEGGMMARRTGDVEHQPRLVYRRDNVAADEAVFALVTSFPEGVLVFRWHEEDGRVIRCARKAGSLMPHRAMGRVGQAAIYLTPYPDAEYVIERMFHSFDDAMWLPGDADGHVTRMWDGREFQYAFPEPTPITTEEE